MTLDPDRHYLRQGYIERAEPDYFVDQATPGVVWQPDVYPEAHAAATVRGRDVIIDLGCGRAGKLMALHEQHPGIELVGVDIGPNIDWCLRHLGSGRWLKADLEVATTLPLAPEVIARSVVVCSDVLEHLTDPRPAMRLICWLLGHGAGCAVISTPARDKRAGTDHPGPPFNPSHVREWTQREFTAFVTSFPVRVERSDLTRSDDSSGGLTTQLVVLTAAGARS